MKAKTITLYDKLLFVLAIASLLALLLNERIVKRVVVVTPDTAGYMEIGGDEYSGGSSKAEWVDKDAVSWRCHIGVEYEYPYCSFRLFLTENPIQGLDLEHYENIRLWLKFHGDSESIRLFLRNRNPAYTNKFDLGTAKYNIIEIPTKRLALPLELSLEDFRVADWWLLQHDIPIEHSHPEFSNVIVIEVQTGTGSTKGVHNFEFNRMEFEGRALSVEQLYSGIIIAWVLAIIGLFAQRMLLMRKEINNREIIQRELVAINSLLNIKSQRYKEEATTDPLTGVKNRAGVHGALCEGIEKAKENGEDLSVVLIDVDRFKLINDAYGHDIGDKILVGVAQAISDNVRHTETLARWGGEEFLLVCPNTSSKDAVLIAENLRKNLEQCKFHEGLQVTASFGVATLEDESIDCLFKRADKALYRAKEGGRNQVVLG